MNAADEAMNSDRPQPIPWWVRALIVAAGSLLGAWFATFFFAGGLLHPYTLPEAIWNCAVGSFGVVGGGLVFSWASKR
jgi:hypothetical protein